MKHAERIVIYSGLALCLALGAGWRGLGAPASALSPAPLAEPKPVRIATIDLGKLVVDQFVLNDGFKAARDLEAAKMKPLQDMLLGMKTRLEKMDQKAPEFQAEVPTYQAKVQELQKMEGDFAAYQASQVVQATKEVAAAAKKVAEALGYTHVIVSRPMEAEFRGQNPDAALSEALQRTVLVGEGGTDITAEVRKDMKIPDAPMTVTPTGPIGPPAPANPGAPAAPKPADNPPAKK